MSGEFVVVYDLLPEIAAKIEETASKVVRKVAFDMAGHAMANTESVMTRRTGFLVNSIYVKPGGDEGDNPYPYSGVQQPDGDQVLLPEVEKPAEKTTAIVAVGANYGWFLEFGTSRMSPHPYFTPAVEYVRPEFEKALDKILEMMEVSAVK